MHLLSDTLELMSDVTGYRFEVPIDSSGAEHEELDHGTVVWLSVRKEIGQ